MTETALFYVFSAILLFSSFRVITARSTVYAALFLVVDPENHRARRTYDRAGFEGSHWLLMAKRLG